MEQCESFYDFYGADTRHRYCEHLDQAVLTGGNTLNRVFVGYKGMNSVRVDFDDNPEVFQSYIGQIKELACQPQQDEILRAVYDVVTRNLNYSEADVEAIFKESINPEEGYVDLSVFMLEGVGTCIQQTLTCAALLEILEKDQVIRGKTSCENSLGRCKNGHQVRHEGHAWVRYTDLDGEVTILDPAAGFFGSLEESLGELARGRDYRRPGELGAPMGKRVLEIGKVAVSNSSLASDR